MKKLILMILMIPLLGGSVLSQPVLQWAARFNGAHDSTDVAKAVTTDIQGNVYVTGYCTSLILFTQIVTIKYSPAGAVLWSSSYGSLLFNEGNAICIDDSNNVYVAGFSYGLLSLSDFVVIKYNSSGVQQWVYRYNGQGNGQDAANSIVVDAQHNVYVTGSAMQGLLILGNLDYVTIKLNVNGIQQWAVNYDGPVHGDDIPYKIVKDNLNNVIVTGSSAGSTGLDYATVKYNSSGTLIWAKRYDGPGHSDDIAKDIAVDHSNNVIVTGSSRSGSASGTEDYATIKYDQATGNQQWVSRYNGTGNGEDRAYAIVVDNSDNVIITGASTGNSTGMDYATVKYDSTGSQRWVSRYNGTANGEDRAYAIVVDNSDNVYITGSSTNSSSGTDYTTLKYDPINGSQIWTVLYNGTGNSSDIAYAITLDNVDNVLVTGSSRHSSLLGSEDYTTVKYSNLTGIQTISNNRPASFSLHQNYPNPFNPSTKIKIDVSARSIVRLAVYDVRGVEAGVLINQKLEPGQFEVEWDASKFSSGIYFCKLVSGNTSEIRKMILLK